MPGTLYCQKKKARQQPIIVRNGQVMSYGSAIRRSVSLIIRLGNAMSNAYRQWANGIKTGNTVKVDSRRTNTSGFGNMKERYPASNNQKGKSTSRKTSTSRRGTRGALPEVTCSTATENQPQAVSPRYQLQLQLQFPEAREVQSLMIFTSIHSQLPPSYPTGQFTQCEEIYPM